jgi:hypothetical protein
VRPELSPAIALAKTLTATLDPGDILTPAQLADRLQVPKSWVFEQTRKRAKVRNANPMPCIRMGKYLRFSWVAVSAWLLTQNK